jgi:glycerophosphoryl diester phosphodiesterase
VSTSALSPIVRVAHRGASGLFPENTLLAFRRAVEIGTEMLELDVQLTRDGALVVMHDQTLERTTNGTGRLADHSLAELSQLDAGQGERIPEMAEVFALADAAGVRLVIELKGTDAASSSRIGEALLPQLAAAGWVDRAIVTSFHAGALRRVRALEPALSLMLDPTPLDGSLSPRAVCAQTLAAGANIAGYDYKHTTPALVEECRLTGLALWVWTPNSEADILRQVRLGVQAVVTDRPDVLNEVLHAIAF